MQTDNTKATAQCALKTKLLDPIFIQLPVASEVLTNARVQLTVKNRAKEHIEANVMALFPLNRASFSFLQ